MSVSISCALSIPKLPEHVLSFVAFITRQDYHSATQGLQKERFQPSKRIAITEHSGVSKGRDFGASRGKAFLDIRQLVHCGWGRLLGSYRLWKTKKEPRLGPLHSSQQGTPRQRVVGKMSASGATLNAPVDSPSSHLVTISESPVCANPSSTTDTPANPT